MERYPAVANTFESGSSDCLPGHVDRVFADVHAVRIPALIECSEKRAECATDIQNPNPFTAADRAFNSLLVVKQLPARILPVVVPIVLLIVGPLERRRSGARLFHHAGVYALT